MKRLYTPLIAEHLRENRQMLFLMGPRQVGKTTCSRTLKETFEHFFYVTWEDPEVRQKILQGPRAIAELFGLEGIFISRPCIVFDEIHKYTRWKEFLKGFYDLYSESIGIIVTGSARLDVYKKGGDSLMGRYFLYRLHPLSIGEIVRTKPPKETIQQPLPISNVHLETLLRYGGFPDPFLKATDRFFNRWSRLRTQLLFQEDLRDLTRIQELKQCELLAELLRWQVGQQTSYESLAKKVRVTGHTIREWLETLRSLYYCFEIRPWSTNITRSLLKEPKYYLWDWAQVPDPGARVENFIASHLLKAVDLWTDYGFGRYGLFYLRDKEQREVDFLVTHNEQPWFLVESKSSDNKAVTPELHYFQKATGAKHAFQAVFDLPFLQKNCFEESRPVIVPASTLLSQLI